jgi:multimeric flavodoxin WrbA
LIERILDADNLIIGSPIYLSEPTSHYRALLERLIFCILSYDNHSSYYEGKVNVALFYTMNAPKDYYETMMKQYLESSAQVFNMLNGEVEIYPVFNTLQVNDYSKYSMAAFDEKNKKLNHEKQFPIDLETAFEIGARLSK